MRQAAKFLSLGLAASLVSACAGNPPSLSNVTTGRSSPDQAPAGSAFPDQTAGAKTETSGFNPFNTDTGTETGGRVVIANPTVAEIMETGGLPEMSFGRPDAPVTIIKYASLTCPHCRRFHKETFPELKRDYIDTGKVRFIIRDFPIGRASGNATIALRCAKPDKHLLLYGKFLEQQPAWVAQEVRLDAIYAIAQQAGVTRTEFDACLKNETLINQLKWVKDRGRTLGIIGTPNFFVQGKLIKSVLTIAELRAIIEQPPAAAVAGR